MSNLFEDAYPDRFPSPRRFQITAMQQIAEGIAAGHKNHLVSAATGAGKLYLGLRVAHKALKRGLRATFVCDRIALVNQASQAAFEYGMGDHGIIQGDNRLMEDWNKRLQIASVQTIASRGWPGTDVLIVDEAHTMHEVWVKRATETDTRVVGLTATPFSRGLGKVFTNLVSPTTMDELTREKVLVPLRILSCKRPDMTGAKLKSSGEWQDEEAGARGMEIIGDVVAEWMRHAEGRKTIVFGATIDHCEELCRQYNEAGIFAATYTDRTQEAERAQLVKEFKKPDSAIRVLISVEALAKGFDVKDVGCVVDCRPLRKSLSTAIQMWGRGLRASEATGKTDCLLLDHSGNITRFAEDFIDFFFNGVSSLDMGEELNRKVRQDGQDERERTGCPKCSYKPFRQRCMSCGFEIVATSGVVHEAGSMEEVVIDKKTLARTKRDLWDQLCAYARSKGKLVKKEGFAKGKFKDLTGDWPPYGWSITNVPDDAVCGEILSTKLDGQFQHERIKDRYQRTKGAIAA